MSEGLLRKIPIEDLMVCPKNLRKHNANEDIEDLAKSLEQDNQREDIHVHWLEEDKKWHILAGQRRYLASLKSGKIKALNCRIHPEIQNEEQADDWCTDHELERRELSPFDIAEKIREFIQKYGNLKEACRQKGWTERKYQRLKKYLPFLSLTEEAKEELMKEKKDSIREIAKISRLEPSEQMKAIVEGTREIKGTQGNSSPEGISKLNPIIVEITAETHESLENFAKKEKKTVEEYSKKVLEKHIETNKETPNLQRGDTQ